ncbi:uncharacterized protein METZ01_LOCUS112791, partial [marine metagenome]
MLNARIAVVGAGWWSTYAHIPALQAHPQAELVAIADVDAAKLDKAASYYNIPSAFTDFREMLAKEELDGVIVAVWHAAHYEVAMA